MVQALLGAVLLLALLLQFPLAFLVSRDARERQLERREVYTHGLLVPVYGYVLLWHYLQTREDLSKVTEASEQTRDENQFQVSFSGVDRFVDRLLYVHHSSVGLFLTGLAPAGAVALLAGSLVVHSAVGELFFAWCAVSLFLLVWSLEMYRETSVTLAPSAGEITVTWTRALSGNVASTPAREIDLESMTGASLVSIGDSLVVKIDSDKPFTAHRFAVPPGRLDAVVDILDAHGVPLESTAQGAPAPLDGNTTRIRTQVFGAVLTLTVLPVLVAGLRPDLFGLTTPILLLAVLVVGLPLRRLVSVLRDSSDVTGTA